MNYNENKFRSSELERSDFMASKLKRMTFVLTLEMEPFLDGIKKEMFYNCSRSEMIRALVDAGLTAMQNENQRNPTKPVI